MFTGITEETGKVQYITENKINIKCVQVLSDTQLGDSIAVNGICLTVTKLGDSYFEADLSSETYNISTLNRLKSGDKVNLERAMLANGRFGGHIVSGHVDGIAKVISIIKNGDCYDLTIEIRESENKYIVRKGSITVDGISLTVASKNENTIKIAVIPHTYDFTNISTLKQGDYVNIEVDILAKYVENFLSTDNNKKGVSIDFLRENGFC